MRFNHSFLKLVSLFLFLINTEVWSQEPNFSMYQYTPIYTNPGQVGMIKDINLAINYRNQSVEVGESFRTSAVSIYYPMNIGNHRLVVTGNFLNDKASGFLLTNGGFLGLAYSVSLTKTSELSLGVQGGYFQRKLQNNFITDDQFVNGVLDSNIVSGDGVLNQTSNYPTLSTGIYYLLKDKSGKERAFIGVSLYNVIEPNISFIESNKDKMPLSYKGVVGYKVYDSYKFSVIPTLRWINQARNNFINIGSRFGYELANSKEGEKKVELGLWYNTNDLGVFSIAYKQPSFTLGVSYDMPTGTIIKKGQNGIFELAFSLKIKKTKV